MKIARRFNSGWVVFCLALFIARNAVAAIPLQINHQGVVYVDGEPFTGPGYFRFAILDPATGNALWSNDGSVEGSGNPPVQPVDILVEEGLYTVRLGDASASNMTPIPSDLFGNPKVTLRVWFDDGANGPLQLDPDHPITSVPYAYTSHAADQSVLSMTADYAQKASMADFAALAEFADSSITSTTANAALSLGSGSRIMGAIVNGPILSVTNVSDHGTGLSGVAQGISGIGVEGISERGVGVIGRGNFGPGVAGVVVSGAGVSGDGRVGVFGSSSQEQGTGVFGRVMHPNSVAVRGTANESGSVGVWGTSGSNTGTFGETTNGQGVWGNSTGPGLAGLFTGNVDVTGNISKSAGVTKVDHPLDPANKFLLHSSVESDELKNLYDGTVRTGANGEATVELPEWFTAYNQDFRYHLTVVDQFAQAIISEKIKGNRFTIKTDKPNVEVCWLITGIRKDPYAKDHSLKVEQGKRPKEKGKYLYPEGYGEPLSKRIKVPVAPPPTAGLKTP